jgi:hypothetical protein
VVYNGLPAVVPNFAFIVPNSLNDMPQFIHYANANNGLVILTMDTGLVVNHIPDTADRSEDCLTINK